ncbi:unnamed protein product [Hyaloperonospora brassicae]|uniref:Uncharacterized protein n=1 Tax=Hyaloperonospora brassicae TaxID=162125 RepID=A0AAV0UN20_HYABA|nr:unnamed protein product [Hyaloperonospora brassicae]
MSTVVVEQLRDSEMATPAKAASGRAQVSATTGANDESKGKRRTETVDKETTTRQDEAVARSNAGGVSRVTAVGGDGDGRGTHSVTGSAIEASRNRVEQMKRRLQVQVQFVEKARRQIMDETHPDMTERLREAARERDHLLEVARQRNEYFQHGTAVIFNYECDEANSEYDLQCEKLRQDMLEEIHHEMEILNDQRKGGQSCVRTTTRKTRSTRTKAGPDLGLILDTAQKIKKRAGHVFQPLEKELGQSEIDHDVRELTSVYVTTKKRRMEFDTVTPVAKFYRNKFLYRDWIFQEGDEVYVLNYSVSSEYAAVICGISSTELLVLSEKGKHYRLVIMDIRQGRVVLTTLSSEQAASRDDLGDEST